MFAKRHGRERLASVPLHTPLLIVAWILAFCMYGEGVLAFLLGFALLYATLATDERAEKIHDSAVVQDMKAGIKKLKAGVGKGMTKLRGSSKAPEGPPAAYATAAATEAEAAEASKRAAASAQAKTSSSTSSATAASAAEPAAAAEPAVATALVAAPATLSRAFWARGCLARSELST